LRVIFLLAKSMSPHRSPSSSLIRIPVPAASSTSVRCMIDKLMAIFHAISGGTTIFLRLLFRPTPLTLQAFTGFRFAAMSSFSPPKLNSRLNTCLVFCTDSIEKSFSLAIAMSHFFTSADLGRV
jgi:hypothetical protein